MRYLIITLRIISFFILIASNITARDFGAGFGTGTVFGLTTGAILGAATSRPRETVVIREQAPTTTQVGQSCPRKKSGSILDELNDLYDQVEDLTQDLNDADDLIANLRKKIANLKAKNKNLQQENRELREKINKLKNETTIQQKDISSSNTITTDK